MRRAAVILLFALAAAPATADAPRHIDIKVTRDGFTPDGITVTKGEAVALVFTRKVEHTCAKEVVVKIDGDDKHDIRRDLPLDKAVEIDVTFPKAGTLSYACGMDMVHGTITVQ